MTTAVSAKSCGEVISRAWRGRRARRALLAAGMAGAGVYVVGDLLSGLLHRGYSFKGHPSRLAGEPGREPIIWSSRSSGM